MTVITDISLICMPGSGVIMQIGHGREGEKNSPLMLWYGSKATIKADLAIGPNTYISLFRAPRGHLVEPLLRAETMTSSPVYELIFFFFFLSLPSSFASERIPSRLFLTLSDLETKESGAFFKLHGFFSELFFCYLLRRYFNLIMMVIAFRVRSGYDNYMCVCGYRYRDQDPAYTSFNSSFSITFRN